MNPRLIVHVIVILAFRFFAVFFRKIINRFALPIIRSDKESLSATLIGTIQL